ncbi:hypothetical protein H696_03888 [Fonticula alba]|uniref:Uncharacterized protein n=1 Tax=Fonticula alba TaxID=691883 RepID=A0A058Z5D4_FONAL|nr:hypothetical protein H696_03888 [Fonticula alba]KCV69459.1 hypothetical protein H696_03888 [Fonticula alba]|eukprot:XP_009496024.1 hypothetical protein H696_03888 [Fonticula alba]
MSPSAADAPLEEGQSRGLMLFSGKISDFGEYPAEAVISLRDQVCQEFAENTFALKTAELFEGGCAAADNCLFATYCPSTFFVTHQVHTPEGGRFLIHASARGFLVHSFPGTESPVSCECFPAAVLAATSEELDFHETLVAALGAASPGFSDRWMDQLNRLLAAEDAAFAERYPDLS